MAFSEEREIIQAHLLRCHEQAEIATFRDISNLIGFDIQQKRRYLLSAAREALRKQKIHFDSVPTLGYRPLTRPIDTLTYISQGNAKVERMTVKVAESIQLVDTTEYTDKQKKALGQEALLINMHLCVASEESRRVASGFHVQWEVKATPNTQMFDTARKALSAFVGLQ